MLLDLFASREHEFENAVVRIGRDIAPVKDALLRIEARIDRHSGIIQGGAHHVSHIAVRSGDIDHILLDRGPVY
jgi:hypothetical protein